MLLHILAFPTTYSNPCHYNILWRIFSRFLPYSFFYKSFEFSQLPCGHRFPSNLFKQCPCFIEIKYNGQYMYETLLNLLNTDKFHRKLCILYNAAHLSLLKSYQSCGEYAGCFSARSLQLIVSDIHLMERPN